MKKQMNIIAKLDVSDFTRTEKVTLEDLNVTDEQWASLTEDDKRSTIQFYIDELPSQPYWVVDTFKEIN